MHYLEAEYESGYVHRQDEQDHSPYVRNRNIFHDILHRLPEQVHGKMVRFSLVAPDHRYDIDWTVLPDNARPINFMHMEHTMDVDEQPRLVRRQFGYQYTDEHGKNHKVIEEIT